MNHLVLIIGPSGSGKSTLARELLLRQQDSYQVRGVVTRAPRPSDGDENDRVTFQEFQAMDLQGQFLESDTFRENGYATHRREVDEIKKHRVSIKVIGPGGAEAIISKLSRIEGLVIHLFYTLASTSVLTTRLIERDGPDAHKRIVGLAEEIENCDTVFYRVVADTTVIAELIPSELPFPAFTFED